ncbi:hypothetical protein C8A00DRAFT_46174 [Chaetomidium leptoderma]|uniref:RBR-type E3 ubiquitin transferase n=1 Tax=Chaetomidium leptoderma TaxID=669021 RepID=A0AAN6VGL5_9PEZI|nr:hypothetical protein C8A00DRAFT_46174 [Chaetomidium leptoderma]
MDHLDGVDPQTLSLIIQMQLEDLKEIAQANAPKGKGRAGEHDARTDLSAAIKAYSDDLTATAQILADEAMCKSIASAVDADADLIGAALSQEDQLNQDRELALELSGQRRPAAATGSHQNISQRSLLSTTTDQDTLERLRALNLSSPSPLGNFSGLYFEQTDANRPESSSRAQTRSWRHGQNPKPPAKVMGRTCIACTEYHLVSNLATSPSCGHEYCRDCLRSLVTASLTDETLFPPRCCGQAIPIDAYSALLTSALVGQFNAKKVEFDTPNRTYCHRQSCSAFVPPQSVRGDVAYCFRNGCFARTCTVCKGASHQGSDCPADPATQDMLRLAAAESWQRCYSCARFVELENGCNHITCRCGAQFCYVCGEVWKTCECAQWDERNLLNRANAIVDRNVGAGPMAHRQRADLVERERVHLMENHECEHASWKSRGGSHQCEECLDILPTFIYECRQCYIMACRRCRFNRL